MNRLILIIWCLPLVFMGIAFYILVNSNAPVGAKVVFSVIPFLIWVLGGIAIYREYHEKGKEYRKEEEVLQEAKRILNMKNHHEEKQ